MTLSFSRKEKNKPSAHCFVPRAIKAGLCAHLGSSEDGGVVGAVAERVLAEAVAVDVDGVAHVLVKSDAADSAHLGMIVQVARVQPVDTQICL